MAFGQFFPVDSLIVSRINGTTSAAQSVDLIGFNYDGTTNGKTFNLSTTAGGNFTLSGSATSEGQMNSSAGFLALGGYNEAVATAGVASTASARRVAVFNNVGNGGLGSVSFVDMQASVYTGNNVRSAYSADGTTVLTAGNAASPNGGWRSTAAGTSTQLGTTLNTRVIRQFNGVTYGSTGSATGNAGIGVYSLNGGTETLVQGTAGTGTGTVSPYDFEFYNENASDYIFIADDRSTATGGGLQVYKGGSLIKTIVLPGTTSALRSLAVRNWTNGSGVEETTIFGIANANTIVGITFDKGHLEDAGTSTFTSLQTAGAGTVFRSIEIVPEPASFAILGLGILGLAVRRKRTRA